MCSATAPGDVCSGSSRLLTAPSRIGTAARTHRSRQTSRRSPRSNSFGIVLARPAREGEAAGFPFFVFGRVDHIHTPEGMGNPLKPVVAKLSEEDMLSSSAYLTSLEA